MGDVTFERVGGDALSICENEPGTRIPPKVLRTFATLGWFGWIMDGIAGQCVPLVFGPSGAGGLGDASAHPIPDLLSL